MLTVDTAQWRETTLPADTAEFIDRLLAQRAVTPRFQPIVDLVTGRVVGVESLARGPAGSPLETPAALFPAAARAGRLIEVDMLCATRGLEDARDGGSHTPSLVFINAEPAAMGEPLSPELARVVGSELPFRIVLEFTERALAGNPAALLRLADEVRATGNAIALDDVGAQPESLAFLPLIAPEVVKLDLHLVRVPANPATIETAAAACAYAERTGALVLAEGIETDDQMRAALSLGARWGQGWLFGRPTPLTAHDPDRIVRPVHLPDTAARRHGIDGTPFDVVAPASTTGATRCDPMWICTIWGHLRRRAATVESAAIVLCAADEPQVFAQFACDQQDLARRATFVGLIGPVPRTGTVAGVRMAHLPQADPMSGQIAAAIVTPYAAWALAARPVGDGYELVVTHDPERAHTVARMLLRRFTA